TKNIIIEIGNFDPVSVRKTSRKLALITDASKRFENEITPEMIDFASLHIVSVIKQIAGGEVVGLYDYYPKPVETRTLTFKLEDITKVLGSTIKEEDIDLWVSRYNVVSKKEDSSWNIEIPKERLDITGAHDIAEEIGRMVGYDKIPVSPVPFSLETKKDSAYHKVRAVKYWLAQNGFREVMNYTFTKKGEAYVAYGAKDKSALRSNLSDGLKESYEKNRLNAPLIGVESVRIFEVGTVFSKDGEQINVATCDKGTFEELTLEQFIEKYKIDTSTNSSNYLLLPTASFKMWSLYPFVTRDIAVWCDSVEEQNKLEEIVSEFAKSYCVREPVLFDRFEKPARPHEGSGAGGAGKTSVAYRLVFQSYEKTLTEEEVEGWFAKLVKEIKSEKGFEIR
ncbi:MAG TPA: phenylalanine--tRNA ligase beta subunit-related protein, partial [Candidatus Paceibacterota bacterium]|nr:phenylalanine--tRNA ligase beta subunit-related protein [Candidatus Paceibacterota bacterium]